MITTHQFHSKNYKKPLSKNRIRLHIEIIKLPNVCGYTKIHCHLIENGFEIGKSRTTVDSIIKKIKKREEFLSQTIIDGIENIFIRFFKYYFKSQIDLQFNSIVFLFITTDFCSILFFTKLIFLIKIVL